MRAVYALIVVFLFLCVFFARWYLCTVRGLCETTPILEILMMILSAFLVGFAGSWLLSENIFRSVRGQVGGLLKEKNELRDQLQLLERENQSTRKHLGEWQQEASHLTQDKHFTEPLLAEAQTQLYSLKQELEQYQRRYENLKQETDAIRDTETQLRKQLTQEKSKAEELRTRVEEDAKKEKHDSSRSRFTPSTWQTKNDLTLISGIGPAIQRKLNELGIYSFEQISQLTPEMVDRVAKGIKFFPDRIGRDNWIGQAAALALMKQKR